MATTSTLEMWTDGFLVVWLKSCMLDSVVCYVLTRQCCVWFCLASSPMRCIYQSAILGFTRLIQSGTREAGVESKNFSHGDNTRDVTDKQRYRYPSVGRRPPRVAVTDFNKKVLWRVSRMPRYKNSNASAAPPPYQAFNPG